MESAVTEREEWMLLLAMVGAVRQELRDLNGILRGDEDEEEEDES